jgi:VWFA-related protein
MERCWRRRGAIAVAVCVLAGFGASRPSAQSSQAQPSGQAARPGQAPQGAPPATATFRSGVEFVIVDANIIDGDGNPVKGLGATDFDVTVDGKPRRVASATYVDMTRRVADAAAAVATTRRTFSSNDEDTATLSDRSFVIAVDHGSFLPGRGKQTLEAARRFLDKLDPAERVAFASYPLPGVFLAPDRDRAPLVKELGRVMGSAERIESPNPLVNLAMSEAFEIAAGSPIVLDQVFDRECGTIRDAAERDACRRDIEVAAPYIVSQVRIRTSRSLSGLLSIIERLRSIDGRKTLVLISAGLFLADDRATQDFSSELRNVTAAAAAANVTIEVLHVDTAMADAYGADRARVAERSPVHDSDLMARGLETLVGMNGGSLFRIVAGAERAFDRVYREMSGFYELAVEPESADRDGKPHTIKVRVPGQKVSVRNRQQFTSAPAGAAAEGADGDLISVIRSGRIVRDLPVRVSTQTLREPSGDRLRVLVRADIGAAVTGPADLRIGVALIDERGQPAGSALSVKHLFPSRGPDPVWPYLESVTVRPGAYTLRLAVADIGGRIGSVSHKFAARLEPGAGVRMSDIVLVDPDQSGENQFVPSVDGVVRSQALVTLVEVYPDREGTVPEVTFEVSDREDAPPMLTAKGTATEREKDRRIPASATFDLKLLPPGDYVVSAAAVDKGKMLARVSRPFSVVRVAGGVATPGAAGPRVRFVPGEMGTIGRAFSRADVLRLDVLAYFLGRLRATESKAPTPAVTAAIDAVANGRFDAVVPALKDADQASLSVTFLKGIALFAKGELEPAANQFREALRAQSAFLPAAFYLGACYAAGGQDEQAVGAWQTSLISESDARIIFDVLADALLRLQDGEQSASIIQEARERWPDDDLFLPRLAVAQNLAGQPAKAIDTLEGYLARHADDSSTMVLVLRILYDAHAAGRVVRGAAEDVALATRTVEMYKGAGGTNAPLLDRWVLFIKRPGAAAPKR